MKPELITFDCAQTLVRVRWQPGDFATTCATQIGLNVDEPVARSNYDRMLATRWTEYEKINCTRDHEKCHAFWRELTQDWLSSLALDADYERELTKRADELMYCQDSKIFQPYEDVIPVLRKLRDRGVKMAVISNWDYSLHRVLEVHGLTGFFDLVVASLEEGFEKPDPRIYHLVLDRFGVVPANALHIGDCPLDDVRGAREVGMRALLLDRQAEQSSEGVIRSLHELDEVLTWTD